MKSFDSLDETFDITPAATPSQLKKQAKDVVRKKPDREQDYEYARGQLYNIVDKMQEMLDGAMEVAANSDHPRAYEVALNGAKNAAEVVEKLGALQKTKKDLEETNVSVIPTAGIGTQNNIIMNGTTADLMKMLKESKE